MDDPEEDPEYEVDDQQYEVVDLRSNPRSISAARRIQAMPPGSQLTRRWRLALTALTLLLALIVLVSAWLPLHNQPRPVAALPSAATQATPTRVLEPTPLPITRALGSPPATCPSAPPLTMITVPPFGGFYGGPVQMSGRGPVWIPALTLPRSVNDTVQSTPPSAAAPAWPSLFIIFAVGPTSHPMVTVEVHDLRTGALAWWAEGGNSPQVPLLALGPVPGAPEKGYLSYNTLLFITRASCYDMTVTWPGGSWSLIFAAG